jgi:protein tyrosine phosphatase
MESNAGQMHITPMHEKIVSLGPGQNVFMRTFMLRNGAEPFNPMREIVMLHYEGWPDFGAPAQPATILSLVEMLNDIVAQRSRGRMSTVLMHCSAGCGRTGTFCTIDSLIDHLDLTKDGVDDDDDIIYQTVLAFREQRMSMVQTLRQYVLCYECVLHHLLNKLSSEDNRMKIG